MCQPAWQRALTEAHRLTHLARPRQVGDRIDDEQAPPLDVEALARGVHLPTEHAAAEMPGCAPLATRPVREAAPVSALPLA